MSGPPSVHAPTLYLNPGEYNRAVADDKIRFHGDPGRIYCTDPLCWVVLQMPIPAPNADDDIDWYALSNGLSGCFPDGTRFNDEGDI